MNVPTPGLVTKRPLVGAIRWDAWHGDKSTVGQEVTRSLSPQRYHFRLPFFARVISPDVVRIKGYSQAIVDDEIRWASQAGIDYWAFLAYDPDDPMLEALNFYLRSSRKKDIRFCLILEGSRMQLGADQDAQIRRLVDFQRDEQYVRVEGNRPLLYVGLFQSDWLNSHGGAAGLRPWFDALRQKTSSLGLPEPYVVIMDFDPVRGAKLAKTVEADAISSYATDGGASRGSYAQLAQHTERFWERCRNTGVPVVPLVMSGWDRRPRIERPVSWESYQKPGEGLDRYYETATPAQLADHLRKALDWTTLFADVCPARTVLIYAWNENDEGGWIVPTLNADGSTNAARLRAIGETLRAWKPPR